MQRREEDACLAKRLYRIATPYVQLIGWLGVAVPLVFMAYGLAEKAQAFDSRISTLESSRTNTDQNIAMLNQKVDLLIDFWQIPRNPRHQH